MNAEILAVGTELLLGNILNTNAQFLSQELAKLGINVFYETVVGDNRQRLLDAYKTAFGRSDVVIATGGLGPTEDDLTKETAAEFFGLPLKLDEESWRGINEYFSRSQSNLVPSNKKQAMIPEGAIILKNDNGTAPGCCIERDGKRLFLLPGPPNECQPMYLKTVLPILRPLTDQGLFSKMLKVNGIGESQAEDMLRDLIDSQENPTIAPYAKTGEVWFRVTAAAKDEGEARKIMRPTLDEIYRRFGQNIYGEDDETLEGVVAGALLKKNLTLACAESCTGGLLTGRLVNVPGVSDALLEGVVTYSNGSKMARLGVQEQTLRDYGAVSSQTAEEMARGVARTSGADIGISTTGIAGPGGGTQYKPVGLVYVGLYINGKTSSTELHFSGDRAKIRERAVLRALDILRRAI